MGITVRYHFLGLCYKRLKHGIKSKDTDIFSKSQQLLISQCLIIEPSRSQSDTSDPVGPLSTGHQPEADPSTPRHTSLTRDRLLCSRRHWNLQITACERSQTHTLDRAAIGMCIIKDLCKNEQNFWCGGKIANDY